MYQYTLKMPFYTRTLRISNIRMRDIVLCSVGVYVARAICTPPNPPPDPPSLWVAIEAARTQLQYDEKIKR